MKQIVLTFGLILGVLLCVLLFYTVNLCYTNPGFESNDILGYAIMVVIFSLTFFGTLNYRNKRLDGKISLGKAFKAGAMIALVGSTVYVVVWLFYYYFFVPDFMDQYATHVLEVASRKGATDAELLAKTEEMAHFTEMYKSPIFVVLITYAEVLPIGLVVAFVGALVLKKKDK